MLITASLRGNSLRRLITDATKISLMANHTFSDLIDRVGMGSIIVIQLGEIMVKPLVRAKKFKFF